MGGSRRSRASCRHANHKCSAPPSHPAPPCAPAVPPPRARGAAERALTPSPQLQNRRTGRGARSRSRRSSASRFHVGSSRSNRLFCKIKKKIFLFETAFRKGTSVGCLWTLWATVRPPTACPAVWEVLVGLPGRQQRLRRACAGRQRRLAGLRTSRAASSRHGSSGGTLIGSSRSALGQRGAGRGGTRRRRVRAWPRGAVSDRFLGLLSGGPSAATLGPDRPPLRRRRRSRRILVLTGLEPAACPYLPAAAASATSHGAAGSARPVVEATGDRAGTAGPVAEATGGRAGRWRWHPRPTRAAPGAASTAWRWAAGRRCQGGREGRVRLRLLPQGAAPRRNLEEDGGVAAPGPSNLLRRRPRAEARERMRVRWWPRPTGRSRRGTTLAAPLPLPAGGG